MDLFWEYAEPITSWQLCRSAVPDKHVRCPPDKPHAIHYKSLLASITILIIDLDNLFLFMLSFYVLYQLVFEINYLVTKNGSSIWQRCIQPT